MENLESVSISLDETVEKLLDSELGFILLKADAGSMYDIIAKKTTCNDRLGMYGDNKHITYYLYPVYYNTDDKNIQNLAQVRSNIIHNIFVRWTEAGYNKRHAKKPYNSEAFMQFLEDISYFKADYVLLLVE